MPAESQNDLYPQAGELLPPEAWTSCPVGGHDVWRLRLALQARGQSVSDTHGNPYRSSLVHECPRNGVCLCVCVSCTVCCCLGTGLIGGERWRERDTHTQACEATAAVRYRRARKRGWHDTATTNSSSSAQCVAGHTGTDGPATTWHHGIDQSIYAAVLPSFASADFLFRSPHARDRVRKIQTCTRGEKVSALFFRLCSRAATVYRILLFPIFTHSLPTCLLHEAQ